MRILMLLSVMAFAMSSLAHAGHDHNKERAQHQICSYCTGYAHLAGATDHSIDLQRPSVVDESPVVYSRIFIPVRDQVVAQPRAPPTL
jgi:hypothetical protein